MEYKSAAEQAEKFLAEADQFKLGRLVTESAHPVTRELSQTAVKSTSDAMKLLFDIDLDVVAKYREWIGTDAPGRIKDVVRDAILGGNKMFFTGCGATGRLSILLDSIWRDFWNRQSSSANPQSAIRNPQLEDRTHSIMAGGDFALIKSVEGFEDFTQFGAKQIEDMGVSEGDVVFAITEGGETSFVIGTAWQGLKKGANVYFMYNNPDDILCKDVIRSREVIEEPRIEKINATTGPMAIMGSTRMQATTIELCMMITILEMAVRDIMAHLGIGNSLNSATVPQEFMAELEEMHAMLSSKGMLHQIADLVEMEEASYARGKKSTYFADRLGIDVLTDTTERSPTFCTPAFRKFDDHTASESWTYLILPYPDSPSAWRALLKRDPLGLAWTDEEIIDLVGPEKAERQIQIMKQIGTQEILRFRIGTNGLEHRPIKSGDAAVSIVMEEGMDGLLSPGGFYRMQLEKATDAGASTGLVFMGRSESLEKVKAFLDDWRVKPEVVLLPLSDTNLLLDGVARAGIKMLLNALSTCVMVRLGRVLGNCMVALVPSNMKLIDRSTRYIQSLTGLGYEEACHELFKSIEYVAPRMQAGQEYPPTVALSAIRVRDKCTSEEAETRLRKELSSASKH